jgi:hypothetical protein
MAARAGRSNVSQLTHPFGSSEYFTGLELMGSVRERTAISISRPIRCSISMARRRDNNRQ